LAPKTKTKITAYAYDKFLESGVEKIEFYINNELVVTDTTYPYDYNWAIPAKSGATYNLTVKAYDKAGYIGTDSQVVNTSGGSTK